MLNVVVDAPLDSPHRPGLWGLRWLAWQRNGLRRLRALARRLGRTPAQPRHLLVGERGEFEALFFLRRQGFQVVERRWRTGGLRGDLDLIAWEGATLCFVEVKTRTARDRTPAAMAVDRDKRSVLRRMARAYRRTLPLIDRKSTQLRFDIVSVYLDRDGVEIELLRDAFPLRGDETHRAGV